MFAPQQFTGHGPSSAGAPWGPPAPPRNNPVIQLSSSWSTAPGQLPGAPRRPLISLATNRFRPAVEPWRTDDARISNLPPLSTISYDEYDERYGSNNSSNLGRAEGKVPISLKQTEFSLKQFGKRMRQPILSAFNKWKKLWVAGFLEKKHRSGIGGQNCFEQLRHGPMRWKTAVAQLFETFKTRLPLDTIDHAEWIWRHWDGKVLKNCPSEVREARNKGRRVNKQLATDLHELTGKIGRCNLQESPNTTFIVVIRWVPNGNNDQTSSMQLHASYTDVRHWKEMIYFIQQNRSLKAPYCLSAIYICNLTQKELEEEYMGSAAPGQMMNDPLYSQISYNSSLSHAFKLKLGHNVKLFLLEMKAATGKDIVEHEIRPAKLIPASLVTVSYAPLLISILRLWRHPMKMKEWLMRRQVG